MSTSDDLKELEIKHKALFSTFQEYQKKFNALEDIVQKQTPEEVTLFLAKVTELDEIYSKIKSILTETEQLKKESIENINRVNDNSVTIEKMFHEISEISEKILNIKLAADGSAQRIHESVESAVQNDEELDKIILDMNNKAKKLEEIDAMHTSTIETKEKIELLYSNFDKYYKEINALYIKIFGYTKNTDQNEEIKINGLKDELDGAYSQLAIRAKELDANIGTTMEASKEAAKKIQDTWTSELSELKENITKLLPGALTTGLSYAYKDKKEAETNDMKNSSIVFWIAIAGLVIVSLIPFGVSIHMLQNGNVLEDVILKLPRLSASILPLYIPVLWIAYSSSKKVNLSKRLIEEYSHKEALSKTFEGLSNQINHIKDEQSKEDLKAKLLYNLLEVSAENPGKLIYDYKNADHPLMDALDRSVKLSESITKLANIPGVSKLTQVIIDKNIREQKELEKKASDGIAAIADK